MKPQNRNSSADRENGFLAPPRSAFVLAAGRGERLRPYTDSIPKPLLIVQGRPLLDHILLKLESFKIERVVLNACYLKDQIVSYVNEAKERFPFELVVSEEPELVGTGGGLKRASQFLLPGPFLMMNGDCLWSGDLSAFVHSGLSQSMAEGVWWLAPHQKDQTTIIASDKVIKIGEAWTAKEMGDQSLNHEFCFSGVQLFRRLEPSQLPDRGSIVHDYWIPRLNAGARLGIETRFLNSWQDIGTPERYESVR